MNKVVILLTLFSAGFVWAAPPGPSADLFFPPAATWSGCSLQTIQIVIVDDSDNVDLTTIDLEINGTHFLWPDAHLSWDGDSILTFTPTVPFSNGITVNVILDSTDDDDGWHLQGAPRSWEFYIDLDYPFFVPASRYPPPDTIICSDVGSLAIMVMDTTSGIPYDGLCMCFNTSASGFFCPSSRGSGLCWQPSADTNIVYQDSVFFVRWSAISSWFADEDSIEVCLRKAVDKVGIDVADPTEVCGSHWFDTLDVQQCWSFLKDCIGPRVFLIFPNNGDTTACDSIVVGFTDISGVDTMLVQISVTGGGMPYINSSAYFNASSNGDTAFYISVLPEGNVVARIMRARDRAGNTSSSGFPSWSFYVDKTAPVVSSPLPPDGGVASSSSPNISIAISDVRTAVNPNSIVFNVDGTDYPYTHPAVTWDGSRANFSCTAAGLSFSDGDTVDVCFTNVCDVVRSDRCGPNCITTPFCWSFIVDQSGPSVELILPPDSGYSACTDQNIVLHLWDVSGVDSTTIVMTVEGVVYDSMDHLTYRNDTLTFTPTVPWTDGQVVNWSLDAAEDFLSNPLSAPFSGIFTIDISPPNALLITPPCWTHFGSAGLTVEWTLMDAGAGVDPNTAVATVKGYDYFYPGGFSWDGSHLDFDISSTGLSFTDGETVSVCLDIGDAVPAEFCGPNTDDTCTYFIADLAGPIADMVYPPDSAITACASGEIAIWASDLSGLDQTSAQVRIDGILYSWGSPRLSWSADTLIFTPASPFTHGDTVAVELVALEDTLGNGLSGTYNWFFIVDTEPPILTGYSPPNDGEISSTSPTIRFWLEDEPAGVDTTSITISINGTNYNVGDLGCNWSSGQVIFNCGLAGLSFSDGDTVDVCFVSASDLVPSSLCGPNTASPDSCWFFRIDLSGPSTDLLLPLDGAYTSCANQQIQIYIYDDQGILPESTAIRVNNDTLRAWLGEIAVVNDTAFYTPSSPFSDGEVVIVQVVHATDSLGNTTTGGDVWSFTVDLSDPVWYMTDPLPGSFISDPAPTISLWLIDSISGVDPSTFSLRIEGSSYVGMLPGITWIDPNFEVDLGMLGYFFADGDTIDFCMDSIADIAVYCGANWLVPDSCWQYYVDLSGPSAQLVYPDDGVFYACASGTIVVALSDNFGVVDSTVRFSVDAHTYSISDAEMWITADTIYFVPPMPFSDGDTISIEVVAADDFAGNSITSGGPWQFIMDTSGPLITSILPSCGSVLSDAAPTIVATAEDAGIGIDEGSALVWVADSLVVAGVSYNSLTGEITFDASVAGMSFSSGDTVSICFSADDSVNTAYCGPNTGDSSCCAYTFDLAGPIASVIEPLPGTFSSCSDQNILIALSDDYGVAYSSINLRVNGSNYTLSDTNLSYIGDSILVFYPPAPLPEGDITVILWGVTDGGGNPLVGDSLVFTFTTDYTPPYITSALPLPGSIISSPSPIITVDIADDGSGVRDSSITIRLNGVGLTIADGCLTWDGSTATLDPSGCGISFDDGDTVEVCVSASDHPDYCSPNAMTDSCWQFFISSSGPAVVVVEPTDGQITACNDQNIFLYITDGNGVDALSIQMVVNGATYTTGNPELAFYNDTLHFVPSTNWTDGETVAVQLVSADDVLGTPSPDVPLNWSFVVDLSPPYVSGINPPSGTGFSVSDANIAIALFDDISGVNPLSIQVRVGTSVYSYPAGDMDYSDDTLRFSLSGLGYTPADGESLQICLISASDQPDLCLPNSISPYCFCYYFDYHGPQANLYFPVDSHYVSCWDTSIIWTVWDPAGVDSASIVVNIDGSSCDLTSPLLSLSGPYLTFDPDSDFVEGSLFPVEISAIGDGVGNVEGPLYWWVGFDTTSPVISDPDPPDGGLVTLASPTVSVVATDNAAGVFPSYSLFIVNGVDTLAYYDGDVTWDGSRLYADFAAGGIVLTGGDTVEVCVVDVMDSAFVCGFNTAPDFCWSFRVDEGGPSAILLSPPNGSITSCAQETLLIRLRDNNGVDWDYTRITVDGIEYLRTDPQVSILDDSTFAFVPTMPFTDGDTIEFYVSQAADTLGHITTTYTHWNIFIDTSPPYAPWVSIPDHAYLTETLWQCVLLDDVAGVDTASMTITVNGTPASFRLSSDTFTVDLSGFSLSDGDTVSICVSALDLVNWCPPNEFDTCYTYFVDYSAPTAELLYPSPGAISSCANQNTVWRIEDVFSIDEGTILVTYEDDTFGISDSRLDFEGDTLVFSPPTFSDGDTVRATLISASDDAGNTGTFDISTWYVIDLSPPYLVSSIPADGAIIADGSPEIWLDIDDDIAGIDPASIVITIDGDTVAFLWDADVAHIFCDSLGITFSDGDTVEICISASDAPDICTPNAMSDTCITFSVNLSGPSATIIAPSPNSFVACGEGEQQIIMTIFDIDGIVDSTIALIVDGDTLTISSPLIVFEGDTLSYTPSTPWLDGDTINCALISVEDSLGNGLASPVSWSFIIDLSPPIFTSPDPPDGGTVPDLSAGISLNINDILSGVDSSSIMIWIEGEIDTYSLGSGIVWDGMRATVPESLLHALGGIITVCAAAADNPNFCDANSDTFCWSFTLAGEGPTANAIVPADGQIISCGLGEQSLSIYLHDDDGVDEGSIVLDVDGISVSFTYSDDTLRHSPSVPWNDGDTVRVTLTANDLLSNAMSSPLEYFFIIDTTAPIAINPVPAMGAAIVETSPVISVLLTDSIAGVDESTISLIIEGDTLTLDSAGIFYDGDSLILDCSAAGYTFAFGDTINICISANDLAEICGANEMMPFCWWFHIPECIMSEIVAPPDGAITSCINQEIYILVPTTAAIDSIALIVDGDTLGLSELTIMGDTMVYAPSSPFSSGDTVVFTLLGGTDALGVPICSGIESEFIVDSDPPIAYSPEPTPGSDVAEPSPIISIIIDDSIAGIDTTSIALIVNGDTLTLDSAGVTYAGDTLIVDCATAGISFSSGDMVSVCAIAADNPDLCPSNVMTPFCWGFTVTFEGPSATLLFPPEESYVACDDTMLLIYLTDPDTIDESTIELIVDGITYTIDSAALDYSNDTLIYFLTPSSDGDTVSYILSAAFDMLGNPLAMPLSGWFIWDLLPPYLENWGPTSTTDTSPLLWFIIGDSASGVDWSTFTITIATSIYDTSSSAVWLSDDTIYFDCSTAGIVFAIGDTTLCLQIQDTPDFCAAHILDTCVTLTITPSGEGPNATLLSPNDSAIVSCTGGNIKMLLTDSDGILSDSAGILIGDTLRLVFADSPAGLNVIGDTVFFDAHGMFSDGDTVRFSPVGCDIYFNPVAEHYWTLIIDTESPSFAILSPSFSPVMNALTLIKLSIEDNIAGVDADSITATLITSRGNFLLTLDSAGVHWNGDTFTINPDEYNGGAPWTPTDDSILIYFHERETIFVAISACDSATICGENCGEDTFMFYTGDDDTLPPELLGWQPDSVIAGEIFDLTAFFTDSSGLGPCCFAIIDGETISVALDSLGGTLIAEIYEITAPSFGETLWVEIHICDGDYDLEMAEDISDTVYLVPIVPFAGAGPTVQFIQPQNGEYTSCADGPIIALFADSDGIDYSSAIFVAGSETLDIVWRGDTAYLMPTEPWNSGDVVNAELIYAQDLLGNPAETISVSFTVDTVAPEISLLSPDEGIISGNEIAQFDVEDALSGVGTVFAVIGGDTIMLNAASPEFSLSGYGTPGESLSVEIIACDGALYCGANCASENFSFLPAPETDCDAYPIPFTPNGDGKNDRAYFDFPEMAKEGAIVSILTPDGVLVRKIDLSPSLPQTESYWDGTRRNGTQAPPGIYIYLITRNGEVLCKGTIVLAR